MLSHFLISLYNTPYVSSLETDPAYSYSPRDSTGQEVTEPSFAK